MGLHKHPHSYNYNHPHTHPHIFPSFLRKFPRMSASCLSPPQLPQEIIDFEDALLHDLSSLKPHDKSPVLCLEWLARGLDLVLAKHKEAVQLIPPFRDSPLLFEENWVTNYFDQTTRILGACNLLSSEISNLEQGHLLLRYSVNALGDPSAGLNEDKVSRALDSLRQWIHTIYSCGRQCPESSRTGKCSALLSDMCSGLVVPKDRDSRKGFLFALYGANATAVFIFAVLMIALSRDEYRLSVRLPLPEAISWTAPIFDLLELARGEARSCISAGSVVCLHDLQDLNSAVTGLVHVLDVIMMEKEFSLKQEQKDKLARGIDSLSECVNVLAERLESLKRKQNEIFLAVVASRSTLLDHLGRFGAVHEA